MAKPKNTKSNGDRMPLLPASKQSKEQKQAIAEVVAGPRGKLIGPFIPAMRSPEFMRRLQKLGEYLRYSSALGPKLGEMAILITARLWTQQFEWDTHAPIALKAGISKSIVQAIAEGRRPEKMDDPEATVYDFLTELHQNRSVSDATYARAVKSFGENGVIDMTGTLGYYSTLAMIMNVARTASTSSAGPLRRFPI
jgi:4-carboxymuconolactone decarboxylase